MLSYHYNVTGADDVHCLWDTMCDPLLEAVRNQTDDEVLLVMMESLCKVCSYIIPSELSLTNPL